jgi:hypothetical protein
MGFLVLFIMSLVVPFVIMGLPCTRKTVILAHIASAIGPEQNRETVQVTVSVCVCVCVCGWVGVYTCVCDNGG